MLGYPAGFDGIYRVEGSTGMTPFRRSYSATEQRVDRVLHWLGILAAAGGVVGLVLLIPARGDFLASGSILVYGAGLLLMLGCSALCNHDLSDQSRTKALFRRLDHSAILFMIAATYTPLTLVLMGGVTGWTLFGFVWLVALTGIAITLAGRRGPRSGVTVGVCLLLGWSVIAALEPLLAVAPLSVLTLLLAGGLLYTVGVLFYLWKWLPYHVSIWHGFVLAAAGCHYTAILHAVVL